MLEILLKHILDEQAPLEWKEVKIPNR